MLKQNIVCAILLSVQIIVHTQTRFEFGYSFGANATTCRTIKSDNMTWGYYTPPLPSTWSNHWSFGWGNRQDKMFLVFDGGGLGPTFQIRAYPNKYPLDDKPDDGSAITNFSTATGIRGRARQNSNLLKLSLLYKHTWSKKNKWESKSIFGLGYLKTRVENNSANFGSGEYIDSLGWVSHNFRLDKYEYFRVENLYITFGYQLTYQLGYRWNWNAQIMYNQGLFKMVRWHTYRFFFRKFDRLHGI